MPTMKLAQQLKQFSEEILDISKDFWAIQSRNKQKSEADITETEFLTLDLLSKHEPLSVGEIQRQIGVLPAQMSRIIRSLEKKGDHPQIVCKINPDDKRKIDVELTPAGRKSYEHYRQVKLGSIERMLRGLNDHDRQELLRILRLVRENTHK